MFLTYRENFEWLRILCEDYAEFLDSEGMVPNES